MLEVIISRTYEYSWFCHNASIFSQPADWIAHAISLTDFIRKALSMQCEFSQGAGKAEEPEKGRSTGRKAGQKNGTGPIPRDTIKVILANIGLGRRKRERSNIGSVIMLLHAEPRQCAGYLA